MNNKNNKGFTLIELLVSVAIVAILSAIIITSISSSRMKARDAKRISDIAQLQLALEQYFTKHGSYPTLDQYPSLSPTYISEFPKDPITKSSANYIIYAPDGDYYDYILKVTLEKSTGEGLSGTINGYECNPNTVDYCVSSK